ncbi:hypothetical protein E4U32_006949 [Claviceps aff. humidiphila group G2b]|nr:hypothetical protein E4U32_006949 [Claviceps aff. humidiphila group G2b]
MAADARSYPMERTSPWWHAADSKHYDVSIFKCDLDISDLASTGETTAAQKSACEPVCMHPPSQGLYPPNFRPDFPEERKFAMSVLPRPGVGRSGKGKSSTSL